MQDWFEREMRNMFSSCIYSTCIETPVMILARTLVDKTNLMLSVSYILAVLPQGGLGAAILEAKVLQRFW